MSDRRFDREIPIYRKGGHALPDTEDLELTAFLLRALCDAQSKTEVPPACPHCGSRYTVLSSKIHARLPRPSFVCTACRKGFNRLTGTPLARLRHEEKLPYFVRLLSQQLSYAQAAERLGIDYSALANWVAKFRIWLMQLDPTGKWESRVRLGIKHRPILPCNKCASTDIRYHGFEGSARDRRYRCMACGAVFRSSAAGATAVAYDPSVAAGRFSPKTLDRSYVGASEPADRKS